MIHRIALVLMLTAGLAAPAAGQAAASGELSALFPGNRLGPTELAIIVNTADPLSVKIARYYQKKRKIPSANIIKVRFKPGGSSMSRETFEKIKSVVDAATPPHIQAYALTWAAPYRVGCMSITAAFADRYDETYCTKPCGMTKLNPYFNSTSVAPYRDYGLRPTMAIAANNFKDAVRLIDRGVSSDGTHPGGTGYLVDTTDKARNVRAVAYPEIIDHLGGRLNLEVISADYIENKHDVLFYFTGISKVKGLKTLRFTPGAIADHLTSTGGQLTNSKQMSSLRWLEAGATGSYGTVVEPCNLPPKFPNPGIVISHYLRGESLIEAYWKSVAMPGQGIFIGEPLAAPYSPRKRSGM